MVATLRLVPAVRPVLLKLWLTAPDVPRHPYIATIEFDRLGNGRASEVVDVEFNAETNKLIDWKPAGLPEWIVSDVEQLCAEVVHNGHSQSPEWGWWTEAN